MKVIFEMDDEVEVGKPVRMERVGELVQCKDCKHIGNMYKCPVFYSKEKQSDNWYCADGVKRDE